MTTMYFGGVWRKAVRLRRARYFDRTDKERAVHLALGAASKALKEGGCPSLDQIISVVVDATGGREAPFAPEQTLNAALKGSGGQEVDAALHRVFDFDPSRMDGGWDGRSLVALYAMRGQAERLRQAIDTPDPHVTLFDAYPELDDVVALHARWQITPADVTQRLVRLYETYLDELAAFFATFAQPGWGLAPPIPAALPASLPATG